MLVTDVGAEICWLQLWDFGDGFGHFGHQFRRFLKKYDQIVHSYFYQSMISDEKWVGHGIVTVDPKV